MSDVEKHEQVEQLERIRTEEDSKSGDSLNQVQTHETIGKVDLKNKQAFKGDESDGKFSWGPRKWVAALSLAMLYTGKPDLLDALTEQQADFGPGSQVPLYFTGATLSFIAETVNAPSAIGWLPVANTLAIAAVCPFVGYLQDLFGKRYIALFGALLLCVGCIVLGTTHSFGQAIVGLALAGGGAGIGELTGLAGLAETVPVRHRGYSLAALTAIVLPFCPYVLYAELFSNHSAIGWRWGPWISLIYNGLTLFGLAFTYFPHAHLRTDGMSKMAVIKRIDFLGGFLSILGLTLFLVALQAGGNTHPWSSPTVLGCLLVGVGLLAVWFVWEMKFAKYPMVPFELFKGQRVVALSFAVAFIAGANFFSLLNFWPLTISTVWDPIPIKIGLRALPVGFSVALGAIFWNALLSVFTNKVKWVLFAAATMLTAFGGALSVMNPENALTTIALATLAGFGLGGVIVPAATVAMIAAPDALITTCAALSLSVRAVGGAIGYSIYYNIFVEKLTPNLTKLVPEYAIAAGLPLDQAATWIPLWFADPVSAAKVPGITPAILEGALTGSQWAYANSLHYVWWMSIAFGVCAMICAALLPDTEKFQTNRIAVELS